jgi:nicotinamide-nucleotide amidase
MLAEEIGDLLRTRKETLAVAESCTGGKVADMITDVPGSSGYFLGGVISYSNEAKVKFLGVSVDILKSKGAVSEEVAIQMARGVRESMGSTYGIGITGIAGPTGGSKAKPVGLVFIAVSSAGAQVVERQVFKGPRTDVKTAAANRSLAMLLKFVNEH